ncbi:C2 family cysteine protease [Endozoicomonas gorgoniicola]|uniref:C2 family cysteine protease n=1 Tax=Endozoicomonas gorgoniicola TaxID=1234144 RepID=A0ABT3MTT3_9GAMM|nr:C2 family cysteine protease [Endozoicomonas gorgoniicola]MCW7552801.1 C2 family cysteine protease [Endozoicomonas gorgoniicola]
MKPIIRAIFVLLTLASNHLLAEQPDFRPDFATAYRHYEAIESRFDTDGDNQLSYEELIEAFHAPHLTKSQYQAVRLYLVNFDTLQTTGTARLSQNSLIQANFSGQQLLYNHEKDWLFWSDWLSHPDRSAHAIIYYLMFPYGLTSITPDNILQKNYPDCVLIAALASIANSETGKRLILQYFQGGDSGGVYVAFPGVPEQSFYIRLYDIVANENLAESRDRGLWPGVLESAFAVLPKNRKFKYNNGPLTQIKYGKFAKLHGVDPSLAFAVLTGASTEIDNIQLQTEDHLAQQLNKIIKEDRIAFLTMESTYSHFRTGLMSKIIPYHAYSIIGYNEAQRQVLLRNPHGNSSIIQQSFSVLPHKTNTSGKPQFVYEFLFHSFPKHLRKSFLFTEEQARSYASPASNITSNLIKSIFQSAIDNKRGIDGAYFIRAPSNSETSQELTGIVRMSLEEAIHSFNHLTYTACGLSYCFP